MRKLFVATLASAALCGPALAADMPVYTPEVAAAAAYDWSGFYAGVHGGYGWSEADPSVEHSSPFYTMESLGDFEADDFLFGAQLGANFAIGAFVLGLEADFSWTGFDDAETTAFSYPALSDPNFSIPGHSQGYVEASVEWLSTVRGRVGWNGGRFLPYITGGLAFGNVRTAGGYDTDTSGFEGFEDEDVQFGWTVGAGVEFALSERISLKAEYLHVDLGEADEYVFTDPTHGDVAVAPDVSMDIVKAGINVRF